MDAILEFQGMYRFLSNFYPSPFVYQDVHYKTVEHYFQAQKAVYADDFKAIVRAETPLESKRLARKCTIIEGWDAIRDKVMYVGLQNKFNIPDLRIKLLNTGSVFMQEGNTWGDVYWGVDLKTGKGRNILGKLLMRVRSELCENDQNFF